MNRVHATHEPGARARRDFHFVFGLKAQDEPFHLAFYLALESCRQVNDPDAIHFHYRNEPYGPWWDRIKPHLHCHRVGAGSALDTSRYAQTSEGQFIVNAGLTYAHEADLLRLEILRDAGGCYADMDTLFVSRYPDDLFTHEFAIAEESPQADRRGVLRPSLCNAVMFARPQSRFAARWIHEMPRRFDGSWSAHSCALAAALLAERELEVRVLPSFWFYRFGVSRESLRALFEEQAAVRHDVMSIHLWSHLWWPAWRDDFSSFHAGLLTEQYVRESDATYAQIARRFLT